MNRMPWVLLLVALAAPCAASAQAGPTVVAVEAPPGTEPIAAPEAPVVVVDVGALPLGADEVRDAIGAELEARAVSPEEAPEAAGRLVVRLDADERLIVEHVSPDGSRLVRAVAASEDPRALLMAIAFLAGNLARDQVTPLLPTGPAPVVAPRVATVADALAPPPRLEEVSEVEVVEREEPRWVAIGLDVGVGGRVQAFNAPPLEYLHTELSVMAYPVGPHLSVGARLGFENVWRLGGGPVGPAPDLDLALWYAASAQLEAQVELVSFVVGVDLGALHPGLVQPPLNESFLTTPIVPYGAARVGVYFAIVDALEVGLAAHVATTVVRYAVHDTFNEPLRFGGQLSVRTLL